MATNFIVSQASVPVEISLPPSIPKMTLWGMGGGQSMVYFQQPGTLTASTTLQSRLHTLSHPLDVRISYTIRDDGLHSSLRGRVEVWKAR